MVGRNLQAWSNVRVLALATARNCSGTDPLACDQIRFDDNPFVIVWFMSHAPPAANICMQSMISLTIANMRPVIDRGRKINWGATSGDYAVFRPGPPDELYNRLRKLRIGLPGQRVLDLGTGVMARTYSRRGADVAGIDIAPEQIDEARRLASAEQLTIDFRVAPAEEPPFADRSFEVATANQCFHYFDQERVFAALRRILVPAGRLVMSRP